MDEYIVHGALSLTRGSTLRVEDGRDLLIYVWEGSLWVTQEGERRDRHVGPGGWFRLDREGVALVSALERSTLTITAPQPEDYAQRIALTKSGSSTAIELYSGTKERGFWSGLFAPHARPTAAAL